MTYTDEYQILHDFMRNVRILYGNFVL